MLRISNYNNNNNSKIPFNNESEYSKNINEHGDKSSVEDEDIRIIGTNPVMSTIFSPIGRNIVIPQKQI